MAIAAAPPPEQFPNRYRWTVEECYRLMDAGFLNCKFELIDGEILSKMGTGPRHSLTVMLIAHWLTMMFGDLRVPRQNSITIPGNEGLWTEPLPDVAVTAEPATAYPDRHPSTGDLELVVEVADSTLYFDIRTKAGIYARAGIREYWVVDISNRRLHIHLQPTPEGYGEVSVYGEDEMVTVSSRPEASVRLGELLPPE